MLSHPRKFRHTSHYVSICMKLNKKRTFCFETSSAVFDYHKYIVRSTTGSPKKPDCHRRNVQHRQEVCEPEIMLPIRMILKNKSVTKITLRIA